MWICLPFSITTSQCPRKQRQAEMWTCYAVDPFSPCKLHRRKNKKSSPWFITKDFLYLRTIIASDQVPLQGLIDHYTLVEIPGGRHSSGRRRWSNEKEVHLWAGWGGRKISDHWSIALVTLGAYSFRRGSGAERALRGCPGRGRGKAGHDRVMEPPRGLRGWVLRWREKGSSAPTPDRDSWV